MSYTDDESLSMVSSGRFSAFEVRQTSGERESPFVTPVGESLSIEPGRPVVCVSRRNPERENVERSGRRVNRLDAPS